MHVVDYSWNVKRVDDHNHHADNLNNKHVQVVLGGHVTQSQFEISVLFKFAFVAMLERKFCET